jgi:predicted ATPase/KaiC/GvpD/RAD55 family RecA-like ATPase
LDSLERDRVPSPRPVASKEVPLVDRTEEMNVLKEAVYKAVHSEGGLVFVHGEAGIGKTRLLREVGAYARSRGVQVLYGRCPALFRMDGVPPYIIWKEVIRDYLETCTLEHLDRVIGFYPAEVAKLVPEISQKLRTVPQSFQISPEQEQNRLFEAVSQFITNIAREAPLLVILDDLQWTDPSSLLLLHYLARGVHKTSLLLLGAYRSTDIDDKHPLTLVLAELNRERLPQEITLNRMSLNDVSEMIKGILEQEDVPEEFCRLVYNKTRGNPFFAEEVVKSLKEEGAIYREEGVWKFKEISAIEFPKSVKNVIKARINRLDAECQNVLTMASFIGNDFTLEAMSALTNIEENTLLELMDKLLKTGLIKEREVHGEGICSFADILVRDVVYEEVSLLKRKKLHSVVGCALEKVYAKTLDEHSGELASHFLESGDKDRALGYFTKAAEKAAMIYANVEAASYLQSELRLLEEKDEGVTKEKGHVLERLGDIKGLTGDPRECMKYWDEALLVWTKLQEKGKAATLHRKMASALWMVIGDKEKAREHHEAALKILEAEPESAELAHLYEDMAHMLRRMGQVPKAITWAKKALALAEKLNALEVVAASSVELAMELAMVGGLKTGRDYANRALKIALDNSYLEIAWNAYDKAAVLLPAEEYEKRLEYFEEALAITKKIGDISFYAYFLFELGYEYLPRGQLDKAVTLIEEALMLAKRAGHEALIPAYLSGLGDAYRIVGEWDKSEQYYREAIDASRRQNELQWLGGSQTGFGQLLFDKGEYEKAKEVSERAFKEYEKTGDKWSQMWVFQPLIMTLIELGEIENAIVLLEKLRIFSQETGDTWFIAGEMVLRSTLLRAEKKYNESIESFEKTLKGWESLRANVWNAYWFARQLLCEYAQAYLERNQPGDSEKALNLLNRALEMLQKMGAKKDIDKVEAKIAFIETGKEVSKPKPLEHVSTGNADLDKLLYGGIASNCAVVLTSPSCNERDQLIRSFLEAGTKNGEAAFYVTINPGQMKTLVDEYPSNFYLLVCNPQADAIVKDAPNVVKLKGVENFTDISIALTTAIRKLDPSLKGARRICIGLVSDVLLQHHAVQTRRWLAGLIPELQSEGFTTLAVMDSRIHPSEELYAIVGLFDGEFNIFEKEADRGRGKYLKIQKMSGQEYLEDELPLKKE